MIKQALTNIIVKCSFMNKVTEASSPVAVTSISDFTSVSSKKFFDIEVIKEYSFTLNECVTK